MELFCDSVKVLAVFLINLIDIHCNCIAVNAVFAYLKPGSNLQSGGHYQHHHDSWNAEACSSRRRKIESMFNDGCKQP